MRERIESNVVMPTEEKAQAIRELPQLIDSEIQKGYDYFKRQ